MGKEKDSFLVNDYKHSYRMGIEDAEKMTIRDLSNFHHYQIKAYLLGHEYVKEKRREANEAVEDNPV